MPGAAGNAVIAGHRDTHFRLLKDVAEEAINNRGGLRRGPPMTPEGQATRLRMGDVKDSSAPPALPLLRSTLEG